MTTNEVNSFLRNIGRRIRVTQLLERRPAAGITSFIFRKTNHGQMLVQIDTATGKIRSIVSQKNKWNRWTYGLNGTAGINAEQIYFDTELVFGS